MRTIKSIVVVLVLAGLLIPQIPMVNSDSAVVTETKASTHYDWVFLVYMAGDNNLWPWVEGPVSGGMADGQEMALSTYSDRVNVVALQDTLGPGGGTVKDFRKWQETDGREGLMSPTVLNNVRNARITERDTLTYIEDEPNMGNAGTASIFFNWGVQNYPSNHYCIIFWDHGNGIEKCCVDDNSQKSSLDLTELELICQSVSTNLGRPIDIVGFDACLMGQVSIASALQPYADYFIASAKTEDGDGWDYRFLQYVTLNPLAEADEVGGSIVDAYHDYYGSSRVLSMIDLDAYAYFEVKFSNIYSELIYEVSNYISELNLANGALPSWHPSYRYVPLYSFANSMSHYLPGEYGNDFTELANTIAIMTYGDQIVLYHSSEEKTPDASPSGTSFMMNTGFGKFLDRYYNVNALDFHYDMDVSIPLPYIQSVNGDISITYNDTFENDGVIIQHKVDSSTWRTGELVIPIGSRTLYARLNVQNPFGLSGTFYSKSVSYNLAPEEEIQVGTIDKPLAFQLSVRQGINFITFQNKVDYTADSLCRDLDFEYVSTKNTTSGLYDTYVYDSSSYEDDYPIVFGRAYYVYAKESQTYTVYGTPQTAYYEVESGWNALGYLGEDSISAAEFSLLFTGQNFITKRGSSGYLSFSEVTGSVDFTIQPGDAIYLWATEEESKEA